MYLQRHMVPAAAREVLALRINGVSGEREYRRFYPAGEVASQLVGFTNVDDQGIAGLELAYDKWLQGVPGKKKYIKDLHGEVVRDFGVSSICNTASCAVRLPQLAQPRDPLSRLMPTPVRCWRW